MEIDKSKLKDTMGRPLTQGLFIDFNYDDKFAVYTLLEEDKEYKGVVYPSLKKLYLQCEDPTEYTFAKKYLLGWQHWQRLKANKALKVHFDEWKDEMDYLLSSDAIMQIQTMSADNFQAAKWLADRNWNKASVGRPSKKDQEREDRIRQRVNDTFSADIARMEDYR